MLWRKRAPKQRVERGSQRRTSEWHRKGADVEGLPGGRTSRVFGSGPGLLEGALKSQMSHFSLSAPSSRLPRALGQEGLNMVLNFFRLLPRLMSESLHPNPARGRQ